jgi:LmbE family N-acetylglucosaminyl deacetylase
MKMAEGFGAWGEQVRILYDKVNELFTTLKPDVVITWGPSGWTGHHDHRIVGDVVTEVFQSKAWPKPAQLYYAAIPSGKIPANSPIQLATVDIRFLPVRISVSAEDYAKAKTSWLCHASQYRPETIDQFHQLLVSAQEGVAYFQPLIPVKGEPTTLF